MKRKKLTEFFKTEYRRLVHYVRQHIDETAGRDAEDIVQDVMLNMFNTADITLPIENLSAYVYRSLKNKVIDIFRKRRQILSLDQTFYDDTDLSLADVLPDTSQNTEIQVERGELISRIHDAIDALDKKHQAVVIATEFEGHSFRFLSEEWGVPMGTLLARKSRALQKIKKELSAYI
jgi:RNA polymerase sigma factor (sigma-70 family)